MAGEELELVHPVYLDVPMAISFVAAVEGGVAYEDESTLRRGTATEGQKEGAGKIRLPGVAALLGIGFDMSGRMSSQRNEDESEETRVVRRHTEASLFNLLRQRLIDDGRIKRVASAGDLASIKPGDLIETRGEAVGNPLEQILDLMAQILPYLGLDEESLGKAATRTPSKQAKRSGNPAKAAEAAALEAAETEALAEARQQAEGMLLALRMRTDLESATVKDSVLLADDGLRTVMTLSTEFFAEQTAQYLHAGEFRVVGKVTRVLGEGESINLTRRTAFGLAGPDAARDAIRGFAEEVEYFAVDDPIVEPPALQVLPLAVFV